MSIPESLSASQALTREEQVSGVLSASGLERAASMAVPGDDQLEVALAFHRDATRQGWIAGTIRGRLTLDCRVCLQAFAWPFEARVNLALAHSEADEERLMERAESYLVVDDRVMLHEIVEDEVLLTVPMMPRCPACENGRPPEHASLLQGPVKTGGLAALKELSLKGTKPARGK